ncbi:MAG: CinA family protein [Bradyrhizobium sp.]|nr:MAG: CinA family protein [Bradyrhizobium sp.]
MFSHTLTERAAALLSQLRDRDLRVAIAESCTGGLVCGLLTEIPGSSSVVERGFVVYSNQAKQDMLGVSQATLTEWGAVSEPTAVAMAKGALAHSTADLAVSITGIAGPDGGTADKPVGLVHFACARRGATTVALSRRFGPIGRSAVRLAAVETALKLMEEDVLQVAARP